VQKFEGLTMGLGTPKNIEDGASIVMDAMSSDQKQHLAHVSEESLINEHFGFGMWVRNLLGHWVPPTDKGQYPWHPDDISSQITAIIWRKLQS
jgi:hypothetical protein